MGTPVTAEEAYKRGWRNRRAGDVNTELSLSYGPDACKLSASKVLS